MKKKLLLLINIFLTITSCKIFSTQNIKIVNDSNNRKTVLPFTSASYNTVDKCFTLIIQQNRYPKGWTGGMSTGQFTIKSKYEKLKNTSQDNAKIILQLPRTPITFKIIRQSYNGTKFPTTTQYQCHIDKNAQTITIKENKPVWGSTLLHEIKRNTKASKFFKN